MSKRSPTNGYYALRWQILERDKFTCQYCGQFAPNIQLEVDHVLPVEEGGTDNPENLKTSCYACNRGKSGLRIIRTRRGKTFAPITPKTRIQDSILQLAQTKGYISPTDVALSLNISLAYARVAIWRSCKSSLLFSKMNDSGLTLYYPLT